MADCRSCGAQIRFAKTTAGQWMPVDYDPTPDGNVELRPNAPGEPPTAIVVGNATLFDTDDTPPRYVAHFVTCPDSDLWRKP